MSPLEILLALAIAVGLATTIVPILPGTLIVGGSILLWAATTGGSTAWLVFAVAAVLLMAGTIVKYLVPGRRLKDAGIPMSTQLAGLVLGVVGFFVVPVVGILLGFVLGIFLAEWVRLGRVRAWPSTRRALGAAGLSILIELAFGVLAAGVWVVGVVVA
ncbi:DUF456 domain-containing protein [Nocardioides sp. AN3]